MSLGQWSRLDFVHRPEKPVRVRPIPLLCMVGFKNNLAQKIIMIRQCVANKNHVAGVKIKVTVRSLTLGIDFNET